MKTATKILSVLLVVCFCAGVLALAGSAADTVTAGSVEKGGTFEFGYYPTAEVTDKATLSTLNKSGKKLVATDDGVYASLRIADELKPGDVNLGSVYGFDPNDTYWFEYQPIQWRVLSSEDGCVLLMAEQVLDTHAFNDKIGSDNTWANSTVRQWLNGTFLNTAFSKAEQSYILNLKNANAVDHLIIGGDSGEDTVDRVFLPSFNEITDDAYGFASTCDGVAVGDHGEPIGYYELDPARKATSTDYAKCRGVWTNTDENDLYPTTEFCRYWLRSAGYNNQFAAGVLEDGRVSTGWKVNTSNLGIRPMIRVSSDAVYSREDKAPDAITIEVAWPDDDLRYREQNVRPITNDDVIWTSSDESIVKIDPDSGKITVVGVGTVTITATLKSDPSVSTSKELHVTYTWWQKLIRIFLFGWIWY